MEIIVVGAGAVGSAICEQLVKEGHDVTVVDSDPSSIAQISAAYDVTAVMGSSTDIEVLRQAGAETADMLIAVTQMDEMNILCCYAAKKLGTTHTAARIRNPEYGAFMDLMEAGMNLSLTINPEYAVAKKISRMLKFPTATKIDTFCDGRVEMAEFTVSEDSPLANLTLLDVREKFNINFLVCGVKRGDKAYIAKGDFTFAARDVVSIISSPEGSQDFFKKIGSKNQSVKSAMIVGSGEITHYLCSILKKSKMNIKVIEKDRALCDEISSSFPHVTVVHGDTTNQQIMAEEGIARVGAFLALSDSDEQNMILSLHAKEKTKGKIVTKVTRMDYDSVIDRLNLDTVIYPKTIVSDMIIRYVRSAQNTRGSNMETLYNVIKGEVEASEFIIRQSSAVVGVPISNLRFKKNVLVAAILRDGEVIIPRGYDTIEIGDAVVIVSKVTGLQDVTDILE